MKILLQYKSILTVVFLTIFTNNIFAQEDIRTTYTEDFSDSVNVSLWLPNDLVHEDSTPVFTMTQADGVLNYTIDQKNFYDGQKFNFLKHENIMFDLRQNAFMSVKLKVEPGATYDGVEVDSVVFLASPWGKDSDGEDARMVDSPNFKVPADGKWREYFFDFGANIGKPIYDGTIPPGKLAFSMDDFKLGKAAVPPTLLTSYVQDFSDPKEFL